jgi:hypothetical protein
MPRSSRNPGAAGRARAELVRDPARSNRLVAQAAACDSCTVQRARKAMERAGVIPLTPVREERPKPPPRSRTRAAIAQLGTSATPRQVANRAGCSVQAAWRMLRDVRAAQQAAEAAVRLAAARTARRPPPKPGGKPMIPSLPQPPASLESGVCATAPPGRRGWWTSDDYAERKAARRACLACPVLAECRSWSLTLPMPDADAAVYGGMLGAERRRLRRQQRAASAHPANGA